LNKTEINGFKIDKFNQFDLQVGKSEGICPLCSHERKQTNKNKKCASYDWNTGLGTCHNCNTVFQLHTFERKVSSAVHKQFTKPKFVNNTKLSDNLVKWFSSRGISQKTLRVMKITEGVEYMPQVNKEVNTIHFNYMINNELINVKYRDGAKNFKLYKGAEKIFYNIDNIINHDWCIIVEGEIDVLSYVEAGIYNVVSVPNGATINRNNLDYLDNCIEYFENKNKIIIAVDTDEAGNALKQELIRRLGAEVCFIATYDDCKDANEYIIKHNTDSLHNVIANATAVPLENVTTIKDVEGELQDFVQHGFKQGYQVNLQNFDKIFSTYTGQFITVTGIPSSGKSDWVDRMVIGYNIKYGWKTAFASPENQPIYLHSHKLLRKIYGTMPDKNDIDTDKWNKVVEHINDNFYFIDMDRFDLDAVLRKGAELVKRKGIKCLVIDPYNKIRMQDGTGLNVTEYTMEYLTRIDTFCKKHDVLVIIVAHPTKMNKNQDGQIEEPNMYNIKGGGEWYDASYHGLLVHRNYEDKTVKVKVLKVKFQNLGENQAEAYFRWEPKSGDYIPLEGVDNVMPWEN
tara:strand:- start:3190 stop:4899 length:1710 start_codon:yes stop_codon:yes gene_type:complete